MGNHTDAILSEEGWTGYGGGLVADDDWTNKRLFQANLERHGKGYLSVNYWGPNSTRTHLPVPGSSFILAEDYFVASHLIGNRGRAAVYYGPNQCVDGAWGRCTCASWCTRGVFARNVTPAVGAPRGAAANIDGLWRREFRSGIALVNPSSTRLVSAVLDPSWSWRRRDGTEVDTASPLKLPPTTGAVLTRHARRGSEA